MKMNITDKNIDAGRAFDFGRTSENYAKFRDIYPQEFYDKVIRRNHKRKRFYTETACGNARCIRANRFKMGNRFKYARFICSYLNRGLL